MKLMLEELREETIAECLAEGRAKGRAEGRAEGLAEGSHLKATQIADKLIAAKGYTVMDACAFAEIAVEDYYAYKDNGREP